MKIFGGPNPVFLGDAGVGQNFGQIAPQIKSFDVFYCQPPVIGFQVIGSDTDPNDAPVGGFIVVNPEEAP